MSSLVIVMNNLDANRLCSDKYIICPYLMKLLKVTLSCVKKNRNNKTKLDFLYIGFLDCAY